MAVRNPTVWTPPSGTGFETPSTGADISSQAGVTISTQADVDIQIESGTYTPRYKAAWTNSSKSLDQWTPGSGAGFVVTVGNKLFVTNSGNFLVTNSGNQLVTNPTYNTPKNPSQWALSGA